MNELGIYHLRRIGPGATRPGVLDVMDLHKVTTLIGRNRSQVDFLLDSSDAVSSQYISRLHARVVRQDNNLYRLYDDSLNGVFINNTKMCGSVVLQEGDAITFGHPWGLKLATGVWKRQPDSEYQFIFEKCTCNVGLHRAVLEDNINLENTSTHFQFDHLRTNSNVDHMAHGILNSCVFRQPTSPIIHSPSHTKFLPSSPFIHHGSENLDGASHSTPTKPQKRITDFFHSPRPKHTEKVSVCDVTYGADISEWEDSEQGMCEFTADDGTVRPEMEADRIIHTFGVGNFSEKSKTVSDEIIAEMSNSFIEDSIAEVSNIVIEESIAEISIIVINESIAELTNTVIKECIAETSYTLIEESITEKSITSAEENLIENTNLVFVENNIQESNTSSTEQKMDDENAECDKQINVAPKYIPTYGSSSKHRLQLRKIPDVTISQIKDGSLLTSFGKEPCLTICSENGGLATPEDVPVHEQGDASIDQNDGGLISPSLLLDADRNKAQTFCTTVATSELVCTTGATSEQACTIVATTEQACTTVATSEQACTIVATSEQACTTVATSEQACCTEGATSEQACTTVATSEQACTTGATSEQACCTEGATSEQACTTVATSEQACTTGATSEQACTSVATSEQACLPGATMEWETTQVNRDDGKGTEPLADSGGGNIGVTGPSGPKSDTSPDTDSEKVVDHSDTGDVDHCDAGVDHCDAGVHCDTGVDHCDAEVHCDAGVVLSDTGVDHCDAGVVLSDAGVDHCDAGVDHCDAGVDCDAGVPGDEVVDHCDSGVNNCDAGVDHSIPGVNH